LVKIKRKYKPQHLGFWGKKNQKIGPLHTDEKKKRNISVSVQKEEIIYPSSSRY
jgi:hypothetical protein